MNNHRRVNIAVYFAALVALADQLVKWWVMTEVLGDLRTIPLTPFLNLVPNWNKGVTFGLFNHSANPWMPYVFIGVAGAILFFLLRWLWQTSSMFVASALGLIMGGAIGNIVDRVRFGAVYDFLDFHYQGYHWYAFNVADSAIVAGVGLMLVDSLARKR